jgi:hypothetical protein
MALRDTLIVAVAPADVLASAGILRAIFMDISVRAGLTILLGLTH